MVAPALHAPNLLFTSMSSAIFLYMQWYLVICTPHWRILWLVSFLPVHYKYLYKIIHSSWLPWWEFFWISRKCYINVSHWQECLNNKLRFPIMKNPSLLPSPPIPLCAQWWSLEMTILVWSSYNCVELQLFVLNEMQFTPIGTLILSLDKRYITIWADQRLDRSKCLSCVCRSSFTIGFCKKNLTLLGGSDWQHFGDEKADSSFLEYDTISICIVVLRDAMGFSHSYR